MAGGPYLSPLPGDLLSEYMFGRRRQASSLQSLKKEKIVFIKINESFVLHCKILLNLLKNSLLSL
jgi:hypothetical protein